MPFRPGSPICSLTYSPQRSIFINESAVSNILMLLTADLLKPSVPFPLNSVKGREFNHRLSIANHSGRVQFALPVPGESAPRPSVRFLRAAHRAVAFE